jgi:hypothetical protein
MIEITPDGRQYQMFVYAFTQRISAKVELTTKDVDTIGRSLRDAFQGVLRAGPRGKRGSPGKWQVAVRELAKAGNLAFLKVFGNAREKMERLLLYDRLSFQIVSGKDFSLPWEMIYTGDVRTAISFDYFWGMKHLITRTQEEAHSLDWPEIAFSYKPTVGLLTNTEMDSVRNKELPYFEELGSSGRIDLKKLRALNPAPEKEIEEFNELRDFWSKSLNVAQVACHAFYDVNNHDRSSIVLSDGFPIRLGDMKTYGVTINNRPLVILNACGAGNLAPLYTSNFVEMFLRQGALGVVATECILPQSFAADFTKQLYDCLLDETNKAAVYVAECLLATRRHFLEEHDDPTGLLYSMYAPLATHLKKYP